MMHKYKCSCGQKWFSMDSLEDENNYHADGDLKTHKIKEVKTLSSSDYVEMWENDLEDANYHGMTELPSFILAAVSQYVKDEKFIRKIMKKLYETGGGIN